MIKTTPTPGELQATLDLLSVLALAKDAERLAAAIGELKAAQDEAEERRLAAAAAIAELDTKAAAIENDRALADGEMNRAIDQISKAQKLFEEASDDREVARQQRARFDQWMFDERQKLKESLDQLAAREAAMGRHDELVRDAVAAADAARLRAEEARAAADAVRYDYEARIGSLRATVLGAPLVVPEPAPAPVAPPTEPVVGQQPVQGAEPPPAQ